MANAYYTVIKEDNNRPYPHYEFQIKWNVDNIAGYKNANGFIVQLVCIDNNIIGLTGIEEKPYYEAWRIIDGSTDYSDYDDSFNKNYFDCGEPILQNLLHTALGMKGQIIYNSQVYWIDKTSALYQDILQWETNKIIAAGELPAIYKEDCSIFETVTPLFVRKSFIHEVDFVDENIIINELNRIYNHIKTSKTLYEFTEPILENSAYEYLISKFING